MTPSCSAKHRQAGASVSIKKQSPTLFCSTSCSTPTKSTLFDRTKTTNTSVYYNNLYKYFNKHNRLRVAA